ncbi:ATP-binding protein, partial [Micromonospora sp. NPDC049662]|uniref:ATP-binding protein n=1 Tax=Micromonospora sp. NPDC049662 TaxID=3155397 RepID=UPI003448FAD8
MSAEAGPATAGARNGAVRRVRLPADRRTPAAARAVVRSVLAEAHLDDLVNEALLLTTELTTNAVEHAGTELDIEVVADDVGLSVTVSDFAPSSGNDELTVGTRNDTSEIDEVSERGRGLLLVDHFASRWGTTYLPTGKGVWFRLDRPGTEPGSWPLAGGTEVGRARGGAPGPARERAGAVVCV